MTHQNLARVCTPDEFMAKTESERRAAVRAQIDLTPEAWDQGSWAALDDKYYAAKSRHYATEYSDIPIEQRDWCGTAFCYAGWTVVLAGDLIVNEGQCRTGKVVHDSIEGRARLLLGLDGVAADELFNGANDLMDIDAVLRGLDGTGV